MSCLALPTLVVPAILAAADEPRGGSAVPATVPVAASTALLPWASPGATWLAAHGLGSPPMALSPEAMGLATTDSTASVNATAAAVDSAAEQGSAGPDAAAVLPVHDRVAVPRPVSDQHRLVGRTERAGFHLDVDERPTAPSAPHERLADAHGVPGEGREGDDADDRGEADGPDVAADEAEVDGQEPVFETVDGEHIDADRVREFLEGRGAPLAEEADTIVAAGVEHGVDPRVVVGIAVAESSGGDELPPGSHNAWGWGGTGSHGLAHWDSWDHAIDRFTERLGANYDTDDVDASFARTYCPPNWRWWLETVTWVVDEI